jgi:hypothetical protein
MLGHRFALPHNLTLTPSMKVRYVATQFGGYTENGSNVILTVIAQNFRGAEERAYARRRATLEWKPDHIPRPCRPAGAPIHW